MQLRLQTFAAYPEKLQNGAQVEGATGDYRTQFHSKAAAAADALSGGHYDFVFLHVKAVDDTGHDRQPVLKVRQDLGLLTSSA